jgi:hypothetical protein
VSFGISLWGNSTNSKKKYFYVQNKTIRIMAGVKTISYRRLFKKYNILPLTVISVVDIKNLKYIQTYTV